MCKFIGIDDLAANALIELVEANKSNEVSFSRLIEYADAVIEILKNEENESVVAIYTRDRRNNFLSDYTDLFEIKQKEDGEYIALREGKTAGELWYHFRSVLSVKWIIAFRKAAQEVFGLAA